MHLSRQFIQKDLIIQDDEFGSLKLTEKAYNVLKGKETVMGLIEEERVDFKREKEIELEYDRGLFEILRKTRKEIADKANVPPYVIFPDKTLIEMAAYFPQSAESLLDIHGVGSAKFKKYGGLFLDLIVQYCLKNQINELPKRKPRRRTSRGLSKPLHSKRHFMVGEEYNIGKSLEEIMIKYKFKQSTLLSHLYKYLLEGYPLRGDGFLKLSTIPQSQADIVIEAFDRLGTEYLKPVFEALNEEVNYDELRILRLYYLCGKGVGIRN